MLALFSGSSFPFHLPGDDQEEEAEEEEEEEEEADSDDDEEEEEEEEEEGDSDDHDELDQNSDNEPDGGGELRLRNASMASSQDEDEDDSDDDGIVFGPTPPTQFQNPSATLTAAQLQADRGMSSETPVQDGYGDAGLEDRPEGTGWGRQLKRPRTVTPSASASLESSKGKNMSDEPADAKKVCVCA
jgi:hypothetical protein